MTPHAITPTDTRESGATGAGARLQERASPKLAADFNAACVRMGERLAHKVREDMAAADSLWVTP